MDGALTMTIAGNENQVSVAGQGEPLTFALLAYNQEKYIREAVESALSQDYHALEIILSDDNSSDATYQIMQDLVEAYVGPHRLLLRRNDRNLGLIDHVSAIFAVAKTDYIIIAAGDDISDPHRASAILPLLSTRPLLVHSGFRCIDESGEIVANTDIAENLLTHDLRGIAASRKLYVGATGVWHADLYKIFGKIEFADAYEDLVFGYRAALLGRVAYVERPLVNYRVGSGISTGEYNKRRQVAVCKARIASFQQRLRDTNLVASERIDLVDVISRQISIERAILAYKTNLAEFILVHLPKPAVLLHLSSVFIRKVRPLVPWAR